MKQTWHSIGRSVDAHFLIAHWGYLMYTRILYLFETFDMLIMMIDLYWLRILIPCFLLCFIDVFVWDIDMLGYWWLILSPCLAHWFWFCHYCFDHFTCIHSLLYITRLDMLILWHVYYFDRLWAWWLYHYPSDCRILAYLVCTLMIYLSFAWLRVAWLPSFCMTACRLFMWVAHLSPCLPLSSLGHFLHYGSHFCKCEALCVLVLWPR